MTQTKIPENIALKLEEWNYKAKFSLADGKSRCEILAAVDGSIVATATGGDEVIAVTEAFKLANISGRPQTAAELKAERDKLAAELAALRAKPLKQTPPDKPDDNKKNADVPSPTTK
jgi:hypothetical protein